MSKRGENIYQRKDGRWEGRYCKGHNNGKIQYGYVYAKTYDEVKDKLLIESGISEEKSKAGHTNHIPSELEERQNGSSLELNYEKNFQEIATEWLNCLKPQLKESSSVPVV